jgi:hypothetical protein
MFSSEDRALELALAWCQHDLNNRAPIFPALLGGYTIYTQNPVRKHEKIACLFVDLVNEC